MKLSTRRLPACLFSTSAPTIAGGSGVSEWKIGGKRGRQVAARSPRRVGRAGRTTPAPFHVAGARAGGLGFTVFDAFIAEAGHHRRAPGLQSPSLPCPAAPSACASLLDFRRRSFTADHADVTWRDLAAFRAAGAPAKAGQK